MADNWGSGFATGMAVGGGKGKTQYIEVEVPDLNAERELVDEYAAKEAQRKVKDALLFALRESNAGHCLVAPPEEGETLSPSATKIWYEEYNRINATGLDTDPYLRKICPGLVKIHDAKRAREADEAARAETARLKAEYKAANPGFFARMLGAGGGNGNNKE